VVNHIILNTSPDPVPKAVSPPKFKALLQDALKKATHKMHVANKALHKATAKLHQKVKATQKSKVAQKAQAKAAQKSKAQAKVAQKQKAKVTMKKNTKSATPITKLSPKPTSASSGSSGNSGVHKAAPVLKDSDMSKISILSPKHHDMAISQSGSHSTGGKIRRVPRVKV
jgi:hypothetical protein